MNVLDEVDSTFSSCLCLMRMYRIALATLASQCDRPGSDHLSREVSEIVPGRAEHDRHQSHQPLLNIRCITTARNAGDFVPISAMNMAVEIYATAFGLVIRVSSSLQGQISPLDRWYRVLAGTCSGFLHTMQAQDPERHKSIRYRYPQGLDRRGTQDQHLHSVR
jgi:hypothetical protein